MKLSHHIYLIIVIFTLPLFVLAGFFILTGINKDIDFAAKEKIGDVYQRPLELLLHHISQHQLLEQRLLSGDKTVSANDISTITATINQDLDKAAETDATYGVILQFTKEGLAERGRDKANIAQLRQDWQALTSTQDKLNAADSNAKHADLIDTVLTMIVHSGDKSNLILDPDLDSYYLMDMTLNRLPTTQSRIRKALAAGTEILTRNALTSADTRQLDTYAALFQEEDRDNIINDMTTALQEDKNFYDVSPSLQKKLKPAVDAYVASLNAFVELLQKEATEKSGVDLKTHLQLGEQAQRDAFALSDTAIDELDELLKMRIDAKRHDRLVAILIALGSLAVAGAISLILIGLLSRAITNVAGELHELAAGEGDLTRRIRTTGSQELRRLSSSFNTLMDKLLGLIRQIQRSGTQVTSSSNEIAASTKQLEAAVTEQAASTNEVVATTKEISATSQSLVQTMNDVEKVAQETASLAGSAQREFDGMETTMRHLSTSTVSISTKLAAINDKTTNIGKIVITITKVADQTNLLSLNASIEAEKAGEHGLGFAVVAREIRRLADQTAVATLDIERMVKEMQSAVTIGVMEMDKFTRDVGQGVEEISQVGAQLTKIMERVQELAPRFQSVTEGMQAQSQGAQQISSAMVQLSEAARQTMDSLRQTNSAIQELNAAARGLHSEVSRFKTSTE